MKQFTKKLFALALSATLAICMAPFAFAGTNIKGDVNNDGKTNSADALCVLKRAVGLSVTIDTFKADINYDGKINSSDALAILKISVGKGEDDIVKLSRNRIVDYYNDCLSRSYNETKEITYTALSKGTLSGSIISAADKSYNIQDTQTIKIKNGKDSDGLPASIYGPGTKLTADGVAMSTIKQVDGGYEIGLKIIYEKATYDTMPKFNSQCAFPLDYEVSTGVLFSTEEADIIYIGTNIQAQTDLQGHIIKAAIIMPYNSTLGVRNDGKLVECKDSGVYNFNISFEF